MELAVHCIPYCRAFTTLAASSQVIGLVMWSLHSAASLPAAHAEAVKEFMFRLETCVRRKDFAVRDWDQEVKLGVRVSGFTHIALWAVWLHHLEVLEWVEKGAKDELTKATEIRELDKHGEKDDSSNQL